MLPNQSSVLRIMILTCISTASFAVSTVVRAECPPEQNTCFGVGALESNTTGVFNSAFGFEALHRNGGGLFNTALGANALRNNTSGNANTAVGDRALFFNVSGTFNTASGTQALYSNTNGHLNTANGVDALLFNTIGSDNTASGHEALRGNVTGIQNSAYGVRALRNNHSGQNNTAIGWGALQNSETGRDNTASGILALSLNDSGDANTANGAAALSNNHFGSSNTAVGANALQGNTDGFFNTASGAGALRNSSTGYRNVAMGYLAGVAITTGSDNITIGGSNRGKPSDNGVIRIGVGTHQKRTFIAGIRGVKTGLDAATAVFIDANGQLGTIKSSREVKEDIEPMGNASDRLLALRPVTFRYKEASEDGTKPLQFGLVAEEVAKVFPELVIYDEDGKPETVTYHLLATLLLNEFQKERAITHAQAEELAQLKLNVARMAEVVAKLDNAQTLAAAQ